MASQGTGLGLSISKAYVEMLGKTMARKKRKVQHFILPFHISPKMN
jgi:K+-sensing histidine kinase KdpD